MPARPRHRSGSSATEAVVQDRSCRLAVLTLAVALPVAALSPAQAYTPKNHERSVDKAAQWYTGLNGAELPDADREAMIAGVLEPDGFDLSFAGLFSLTNLKSLPLLFSRSNRQMAEQRFERNSHGRRRDVLTERIAAQSFHGSPNPTRAAYTDSPEDQRLKRQAVVVPDAELAPDRYPLDVYAYDTNLGVRNKLLVNASQLMCVSLAHRDPAQSARRLGHLLHMVGDTYSASHVQRAAPVGHEDNCGTEKIEWYFSMDLISWKLHRTADKEHRDWRFRCLARHSADVMKHWADGRAAVQAAADRTAMRERANAEVAKTLRLLCDRVLRTDASVLARPAGGAAAGYSIASGTDWWEFWRLLRGKWPADRPIQPIGLTGPDEARAFYISVNEQLRARGGAADFWYPPRDMPDLCQALAHNQPPPALQCTADEIEWATSGTKDIEALWLPARPLP